MDDGKVWYKSKTLWFNGLTMIAALLLLLMQLQSTGDIPFPIDPKWIVFIQALINFALRFITNVPVVRSR